MKRQITVRLIAMSLVLGLSAQLCPKVLGNPLPHTWTLTGNLNVARGFHTATLLPNGKVLVHGGYVNHDLDKTATAELYDPATATWTFTGGTYYARALHTATLLPNGKVLLVGGVEEGTTGGGPKSAELYSPDLGTTIFAAPLFTARRGHTATLLANGKVLVTGGTQDAGLNFPDLTGLNSSELYDPVTNRWSLTGNLNVGRCGHTATLLPNGQVLVVGGNVTSGDPDSAELYDPATGTWAPASRLYRARRGWTHTANLLQDGRVLVAGGTDDFSGNGQDWVEAYHLTYWFPIDLWSPVGRLNVRRRYQAATLLPDGQVLIAGGQAVDADQEPIYLTSAEVFDPVTWVWTKTDDLNVQRDAHTMTLLPNGQVLVAGGWGGLNTLNSAELYDSDAEWNYSVTATPISVEAEANIQIDWKAPNGHLATDRIGLYAVGTPDTDAIEFQYTGSATSGSLTFNTPAAAGQYEFRFFTNDSYNKVATSNIVVSPAQVVGWVVNEINQRLATATNQMAIRALRDARDNLAGNNNGSAHNGALDALASGDLVAALDKIKAAIEALQRAEAAGGGDLSNLKYPLGLTGESVAQGAYLKAVAAVGTPSPGQAGQLERIRQSITDGHARLVNREYLPAIDLFRDAVGRALSLP